MNSYLLTRFHPLALHQHPYPKDRDSIPLSNLISNPPLNWQCVLWHFRDHSFADIYLDDGIKKEVTENEIVTSVVTDITSKEDDKDDDNIVKHQDITAETVKETDNDDKKDEVTENAIGASVFTDVASTEDGNDDNNIKNQDITAETVEMMDYDDDNDEKSYVF